MKRSIFVLVVLALAAVGGGAAYQAAAQRNYRALLTRGDNALRDDQTFGAIEAYSGAIALRPDSMLAYLRRGQTYNKRDNKGKTEDNTKESVIFRIHFDFLYTHEYNAQHLLRWYGEIA